jgi:hypothetical protein
MREAITITTAEQTIKPPPGATTPTVYFAMQVGPLCRTTSEQQQQHHWCSTSRWFTLLQLL